MTTKKCNWKTDLQLTETFYTLAENNTLIATPIPDDAIDFQIVYRAEHDCRYTVSRTRGVYMGCKKIDANTHAVFIPLSRYSLGRGPLLRELYMQVPNNDFESKIRNICVPADTKHFLWDGPTDNQVVMATEIITATILKGNTGDSAYDLARKEGFVGTRQEWLNSLNGKPAKIVDVGGLKYWAFWDDATKGYVTSEYRADDGTIVQQVDGSAVSLDVRGGTMYVCGELTSLNIASVENSTKPSIIRFASGATKTQFSYPEDFKITGWTQPEENKSYTICILFGAGNMTYDE